MIDIASLKIQKLSGQYGQVQSRGVVYYVQVQSGDVIYVPYIPHHSVDEV